MLGIAVTLAFLWFMWTARGRLNSCGLEYLNWLPVKSSALIRAALLGLAAGVIAAWFFSRYDKSHSPEFADVWIAITIGPLIEEAVFRGYTFWALRWLYGRTGSLVVMTSAALFALSHLAKNGITSSQIAFVFTTGVLYGWLRLKSDSIVPAVCAHVSFNAVIYIAAVFL